MWFAAIVCPLIFTILGMFMEVTSLFVLLGPTYIVIAAAAGIDPMLAAMMVNPMTCALGHMTPPFALCFMCVWESQIRILKDGEIVCSVVAGQFLLTVLILYGFVPMFGMIE